MCSIISLKSNIITQILYITYLEPMEPSKQQEGLHHNHKCIQFGSVNNPNQYPSLSNQQSEKKQPNQWKKNRGRGRRGCGRRGQGGFRHCQYMEQPDDRQFEKWEFKGRGCGRNRGGHHKYQQKFEKAQKKIKKRNSTSSSSERQNEEIEGKMYQLNLNQKQENQLIIREYLQAVIFSKFPNLNEGPKTKITNFIISSYGEIGEMQQFFNTFQQIYRDYPHFIENISIVKICKVIVKKDYIIDKIDEKLSQQLAVKLKNASKDDDYLKKFPNPIPVQFYERDQLLTLNLQTSLFLIDFDNLIPKVPVLKKHYDSRYIQDKTEAQIRVTWVVSQTLPKAEIFFDYAYPYQVYEKVQKEILSENQRVMLGKTKVFYADKVTNPYQNADAKLIERLKYIRQNKQYDSIDTIVIVSADRQLIQICRETGEIIQTSGQDFIKFMKQVIRDKYFHQPQMKGIIKRIFS